MGTGLQSKRYILGSNAMPNLNNNNAVNGMWALYYEDKTLNNNQHFDSFLTRQTVYGYLGYEKERVRQTIIKQESIFKHQLQELHRLYRRQRELMSEFRSRELMAMTSNSIHLVNSRSIMVQSPSHSIKGKSIYCPLQTRKLDLELPADAFIKNESKQQEERICGGALVQSDNGYLKGTPKLADLNESTCLEEVIYTQSLNVNPTSGFQFLSNGFSQSSPVVKTGGSFPSEKERNENELTFDFNVGKNKSDDHDFISRLTSFEPLTFSQSNQSKKEPQNKRRIFGVEILEGNSNLSIIASGSTPILDTHNENSRYDPRLQEVLNSSDCEILKSNDAKKKHEASVRGLPWLKAKPHSSEEEMKENENDNLYQMNLDSLQYSSPQFFKKVEITKLPSPISDKREVEIGERFSKKLFGFPIVDAAHKDEFPKSNADYKKKDPESEKVNYISSLRDQVDLNLSLNEEESPPSLPKAILKIASTEIDLEAPLVLECETEELEDLREEFDRAAAEALISISSSQPLESSSNDCLLWFADFVSTNSSSYKLDQLLASMNDDDCEQHEESIPKGMDYFEFKTLKLKEDPKKEYPYEMQNEGESTKRPRRGQSKKGKDFQSNVLPGLICLSRHEVREDLELMEDIFRGSGCNWELNLSKKSCAGKNSKKFAASKFCSSNSSLLEQLSGWGRRVPRQRFPPTRIRT